MNETYHIPANFTDAGRVMGLFELRNLVEAVILTLPALYLCLVLLPLELTAKITVTLIIVVPLGGLRAHRCAGRQPHPLAGGLAALAAGPEADHLQRRKN